MIKACIFDLDGVVVDTARYHYLAWKRLADGLGIEFDQTRNEALKGVSRMESLDLLLSSGGMKDDFSPRQKSMLAECKNDWYLEYVAALGPSEILPGVKGFLYELRAKGIRTAIGSASRNAGAILDRLGIRGLFDAVADGTMVANAKPDPEIFLIAAKLTAIPPGSCVVFEDAAAGVEAARRAGMYSVGVGASPGLSAADAQIDTFEGLTYGKLIGLLNRKNKEL